LSRSDSVESFRTAFAVNEELPANHRRFSDPIESPLALARKHGHIIPTPTRNIEFEEAAYEE
jgi:hypothetical protein